jgi:VWFA-related protein
MTAAQQLNPRAAQPAPQQQEQTFTLNINTQLVVETVVVKDKDGKNIKGLTKDDFTITEDNMPQTISVFEYQELDETPVTLPDGGAIPKPTVEPLKPRQITPPPAGDARYNNRRLMVLFFDLSNTGQADALRSFTAADKFIRTQMTPSDLVAVMAFSNGVVQTLLDFTDKREALFEVMAKLIYPDDNTNDLDVAGAFGQDSGEFNIFNTDRQLAALQTAVNMLRVITEKKSLVYFASGLRLNGTDNQAQLRATVNAANKANVSFFPVDARGLVANAPLGDATRSSPGGQGMFNGAGAMGLITNFQRSQDSLYALASDTGGKAMLDNNDLAAGIVQAQKSITSYYVIGYYPTNTTPDGKIRRVKVALKDNVQAKLDFRQTYFATKTFKNFTTADKDRQLEEALMLGDPITDLTIAMELNYFQLNRAEYFVPVTMKIPGSELALARTGGAERTVIDFIGEIKDDVGTTIQNLRDKVDMKLSGETVAQLSTRPIEYDTGFTLLPGKYVIKVLARDNETGRIGTYQTPFTIPNLMREDKKIPISSVVLGSQRADMKEAIFNANKDKNAAAQLADPRLLDGAKLLPSVTRVFSKNRDLYVFLQAYERNATTTEPLVAFVTFYKGLTKAFETAPLAVVDGLDPKSKAVPLRFSLSLGKLQPGEYTCQVSVLDPTGQRVAFWQAPIMLVN